MSKKHKQCEFAHYGHYGVQTQGNLRKSFHSL